jgi:hypothetical protein
MLLLHRDSIWSVCSHAGCRYRPGNSVRRTLQFRENGGVIQIGQLRQNRRDADRTGLGFRRRFLRPWFLNAIIESLDIKSALLQKVFSSGATSLSNTLPESFPYF